MPQLGLKPKDLVGIPWRVAFALQDDGWWLRRDQVWSKPNPMPESCKDRCTSAHEYLFHLTKSARYYFDHEAIKEPATASPRPSVAKGGFGGKSAVTDKPAFRASTSTRNKRSVWTIATAPFPGAHFATFPPALVEPCILAGTSERGVCPNCGAPWQRIVKKSPDQRERKGYTAAGAKDVGGSALATAETETLGWHPACSCNASRRDGIDRGDDKRGRKIRCGGSDQVTVGWEQTCDCNPLEPLEPVPAIVLDPFLGAGTTALVADRLGRHCIGLELSPGYAEMAGRRTASAAAASEKGRHRQSQRRPSVSLCGSLSQREPDANRRVGAGQISTAPRGPLPRRSHAQKIFSRNSGRGCGPDCYIQTFDFACFCRCQFDFLVSLLGSKTDDFTPFLS
jgi:hypothetical protein